METKEKENPFSEGVSHLIDTYQVRAAILIKP